MEYATLVSELFSVGYFKPICTFLHEDEINFPLKEVKTNRDDSALPPFQIKLYKSVVIAS